MPKRNKRIRMNNKFNEILKVSSDENGGVSMYEFLTADNKKVTLPGRSSTALTKDDIENLDIIKRMIGEISTGDILSILEDKVEGKRFLEQEQISLLEIHCRLNDTEVMTQHNLASSMVTETMFSDVTKGASLLLTTVINKFSYFNMELERVCEDVRGNRFLDLANNVVYTFAPGPDEDNHLPFPVQAQATPFTELYYYIMEDIIFRINLVRTKTLEDGTILDINSFLLPMESLRDALFNAGYIRIDGFTQEGTTSQDSTSSDQTSEA